MLSTPLDGAPVLADHPSPSASAIALRPVAGAVVYMSDHPATIDWEETPESLAGGNVTQKHLDEHLASLEADAYRAARGLAAQSAERLLAEAEISSSMRDDVVAQRLAACVAEYGESAATALLWRDYPACCAFYVVDVGQREYDHGSLYPAIQGELGLSYSRVVEWGDRLMGFLDRVGLWRFWPGEVHKYRLESILLHGGLPDDAWEQIWRNWILPGVDQGRTEDDVDELIELALSAGHAAPPLRKTTRDILNNRGDMVTRLIEHAVRTAREVVKTGFVDASAQYGLPLAAVQSLERVLDAPRLRWPELVLDVSQECPVCLEFPEQKIPATAFRDRVDATYDVYSASDQGSLIGHDEVPAVRRGRDLTMESSRIVLPPFDGYDALVCFQRLGRMGESQERRFRWRTAGGTAVWVFSRDRRGRYICQWTGGRTRPCVEASYLVPPSCHLRPSESITVQEITPLTGAWGGWTAHQLAAPQGGSIAVLDAEMNPIAEWALGQTCAVSLVGEDELAIGTLVAGVLSPRVYGTRFPIIAVTPIDAAESLHPSEWSCRMEWGGTNAPQRIEVPLAPGDRGFGLTGDLNAAAASLPGIVSDGVIVCTGPKRAGTLRRQFTRIPVAKPRPIRIGGQDVFEDLRVTYLIETDLKLPKDTWYGLGEDVTVQRDESGKGYLLTARLSRDKLTARIGGIPLNLTLLGIEVEADNVGVDLLRARRVPAVVLSKHAGGFVRLHAHSGSGAEARLLLRQQADEDKVLCCVGKDGRFTETLGFGELGACVSPDHGGSLVAEIRTAGLCHDQVLLEVVPGVGVGNARIIDIGRGIAVETEHPALVAMRVAVKDMTAPWRGPAFGTLDPGTRTVNLEPTEFPLPVGRYGLWIVPSDEWEEDAAIDFYTDPLMVQNVTIDGSEDELPRMGPYCRALTELLLHSVGLCEKPPIRRSTTPPTLPMLPADAEATVSAVASVSRAGDAAATQFGAELMRLESYRYPVSPAVVEALVAAASGRAVTRWATLAEMAILRLPLLPAMKNTSAAIDPAVLSSAWHTEPLLGWLASSMHSWWGDPQVGALFAREWLLSVCGSSGLPGDLRRELRIRQDHIKDFAEHPDAAGGHSVGQTMTVSAFGRWIATTTTKERIATSAWLATLLPKMREGLTQYIAEGGPMKFVATEIASRDAGDNCRTICNLPFAVGYVSFGCLALSFGDPAAVHLASCVSDIGRNDPTHASMCQLLLELTRRCYSLVSQDIVLVRTAYQQSATGELV